MKKVQVLQNFFDQNTPKMMNLVGNVCFILGIVAGIPAAVHEFAAQNDVIVNLPHWVLIASKDAAMGLMAIKFITKFFGDKNAPNANNATT